MVGIALHLFSRPNPTKTLPRPELIYVGESLGRRSEAGRVREKLEEGDKKAGILKVIIVRIMSDIVPCLYG